jgi:glycosyltransferase involved in cell wall biosynthesis
MACGTPVVASQQAVSALDIKEDREVMVGHNPGEFAQKMLALLDSPEKRAAVGMAGRNYVERNHDWSVVTGKLAEVYEQTLAQM